MNKSKTTSTPYDDVFRTLANDCPKLIIPIVNETFHRTYPLNEKVLLSNNEVFITTQDGTQSERITDSTFLIKSTRYHLECQSTEDGSMLVRVFEYDTQLALKDSQLIENTLIVKFPNTAILYLRCKQLMPNHLTIQLNVPNGNCTYKVPVLKIRDYSVNEIFNKKLYFLIPFHIFTYEKNFQHYDSDQEKLSKLKIVYTEIAERLDKCVEAQELTEYEKNTIIIMSKKVLEHIAKNYSNVKEGVGVIMGGKILDHPAKDILNAGKAEGKIEAILDFLEELGTVPEKLRELILAERNLDVLKNWTKIAGRAKTVEEFQEKILK